MRTESKAASWHFGREIESANQDHRSVVVVYAVYAVYAVYDTAPP